MSDADVEPQQTKGDGPEIETPRLARGRALLLLTSATLLTVCGTAAVFVTNSSTGAVALVIAGALLLALWGFGDRVIMLRYKDYELHFARRMLQTAEIAEVEGDEDVADRLRDEGLNALERTGDPKKHEAGGSAAPSVPLSRLAKEFDAQAIRAVREAISPLAVQLVERDYSNRLEFDAVVRSSNSVVGVEVRYIPRKSRSLVSRILLGLHSTPGLSGVLAIVNSAPDSGESQAIQEYLEQELRGAIRIRVVGWQPEFQIAEIRTALMDLLGD